MSSRRPRTRKEIEEGFRQRELAEAHTPLPWKVAEDEIDRIHGGEVIRPTTGNPSPIAVLCDFNRYDRDAERTANANLIVEAVNTYASNQQRIAELEDSLQRLLSCVIADIENGKDEQVRRFLLIATENARAVLDRKDT